MVVDVVGRPCMPQAVQDSEDLRMVSLLIFFCSSKINWIILIPNILVLLGIQVYENRE